MTKLLKRKQLIKVLWSILDNDDQDTINAGIIAHTLVDAESIFVDKLKYTFDQLHPALRSLFRTVGDSAKELRFAHGSTIRVGTSLRSSTLQFLHISEMGKICAKYPEKAREIVSGALQTLAPGCHCFIESTAEGREGFFYELCELSRQQKQDNVVLGPLDYKFFFFPWHKSPEYTLEQRA